MRNRKTAAIMAALLALSLCGCSAKPEKQEAQQSPSLSSMNIKAEDASSSTQSTQEEKNIQKTTAETEVAVTGRTEDAEQKTDAVDSKTEFTAETFTVAEETEAESNSPAAGKTSSTSTKLDIVPIVNLPDDLLEAMDGKRDELELLVTRTFHSSGLWGTPKEAYVACYNLTKWKKSCEAFIKTEGRDQVLRVLYYYGDKKFDAEYAGTYTPLEEKGNIIPEWPEWAEED